MTLPYSRIKTHRVGLPSKPRIDGTIEAKNFRTTEQREVAETIDLIAWNAGLSPRSCANFELKTPSVVNAQCALIWHLWKIRKIGPERIANMLECRPSLVRQALECGLGDDTSISDLLIVPKPVATLPLVNELAVMLTSAIPETRVLAVYTAVERAFGRTAEQVKSESTAIELVRIRQAMALVMKHAGIDFYDIHGYLNRAYTTFKTLYEIARLDVKQRNEPLRDYVQKLCATLEIDFNDLVNKS